MQLGPKKSDVTTATRASVKVSPSPLNGLRANASAKDNSLWAGVRGEIVLNGPKSQQPVIIRTTSQSAFTLLEVIIACAIFFIFAFAVLELVTRGLNAARSIQHHEPDAALILGPFSTNRVLEVGSETGDFEDMYPGIYPSYTWSMDITQPFGETNPLFQVTVVVFGPGRRGKTIESAISTLMFAPDSKLNAPGGPPMFAQPR